MGNVGLRKSPLNRGSGTLLWVRGLSGKGHLEKAGLWNPGHPGRGWTATSGLSQTRSALRPDAVWEMPLWIIQ